MAKFTLKRTASISSWAAMRCSFGMERRNTCHIAFKLHFNQSSLWEPSRCDAMTGYCAHGRCFFAETIALFHYETPLLYLLHVGHPERSEGPHTGFADHTRQ